MKNGWVEPPVDLSLLCEREVLQGRTFAGHLPLFRCETASSLCSFGTAGGIDTECGGTVGRGRKGFVPDGRVRTLFRFDDRVEDRGALKVYFLSISPTYVAITERPM